MAANGMAPFADFLGQGVLLARQGLGLQSLKPLVLQIQGVVYQLGACSDVTTAPAAA